MRCVHCGSSGDGLEPLFLQVRSLERDLSGSRNVADTMALRRQVATVCEGSGSQTAQRQARRPGPGIAERSTPSYPVVPPDTAAETAYNSVLPRNEHPWSASQRPRPRGLRRHRGAVGGRRAAGQAGTGLGHPQQPPDDAAALDARRSGPAAGDRTAHLGRGRARQGRGHAATRSSTGRGTSSISSRNTRAPTP